MTLEFTCSELTKEFDSRHSSVRAVAGVNLEVRRFEFLCLIGPSGCGKTTLLRLIAGLIQPTSGSISFHTTSTPEKLRAAMVFQQHGLFPWLTVLQNAAFSLEAQGKSRTVAEAEAARFLDKLGLSDFHDNYPHEISGGMSQRVAIARALLADPQILLMDEPFGSLDAQTRLVLIDELLHIWQQHRKTIVYVTHDIEEALMLADRIVILSGRPGRILESIPINVPRPRGKLIHTDPSLFACYQNIWGLIEGDVRRDLHLTEETE